MQLTLEYLDMGCTEFGEPWLLKYEESMHISIKYWEWH